MGQDSTKPTTYIIIIVVVVLSSLFLCSWLHMEAGIFSYCNKLTKHQEQQCILLTESSISFT